MALAFDTAGSIVNQAAKELGLVATADADPFNSTNPAILQLCALLTSLGRDIRRERQWSWLTQQYLFSTVAGQGLYPIPSDFDSIIPQTQWNRTTRLPVGGPLSAQDYQALKASLVGVVFTVLDRFTRGELMMYPDTNTPGSYLIVYEYISRWWALPVIPTWAQSTTYAAGTLIKGTSGGYYYTRGGGTSSNSGSGPTFTTPAAVADGSVVWFYVPAWAASTSYIAWSSTPGASFGISYNDGNVYTCSTPGTSAATLVGNGPVGNGVGIPDGTVTWNYLQPLTNPSLDGPTASTDTCFMDSLLLTKGLMNLFRKRKGLDTTATQDEYDDALAKTKSADSFSPVLSLNPRTGFPPLIGPASVPQTGVGS